MIWTIVDIVQLEGRRCGEKQIEGRGKDILKTASGFRPYSPIRILESP